MRGIGTFVVLLVVVLAWVGVVAWVWTVFAALLRVCQGHNVVEVDDE